MLKIIYRTKPWNRKKRYQTRWKSRQTIFPREKILHQSKDKDGYLCVALYKNGKGKTIRVHQLVGKYFVDNPENKPIYKEFLNNIDVLVDGKYEQDLYNPTLKYRGSANQRVIDIKKSLKKNKIVLYEGVN